ncbi:hypothetical protein O6H91_01G070400 [Diphasiastrum complanatum]|uniref:Uncharacterized protein n=2 Tax=Diphasiastrum complanatum TaxID=34168 RepID=A0ACC2ESC1_DIPCM|nr:hypothetical protein O6H91_01G070400 [Diphasiastrum complanatum]KAJ7569288.1 hypothetical protein O6H91_01G070400 [Diphasiastrum complanatum]
MLKILLELSRTIFWMDLPTYGALGRASLVKKRHPISLVDIFKRDEFLKAFYNEILIYHPISKTKALILDCANINDNEDEYFEPIGFSKEATVELMQHMEKQKDVFDEEDVMHENDQMLEDNKSNDNDHIRGDQEVQNIM